MAKTNRPKSSKNSSQELDSVYIMKLVLYMIVGSLWIKFEHGAIFQIPLPIGLVVGIIFAMHEHFQIDRKIEYAMLLVAMFVGFWLPIGIYIKV